jgi:hypothetical protein
MNAPAAGWNPDPTGRHEYRYWDGSVWTDDVSDQGVTAVDPVGTPGGPGGAPAAPGTPGDGTPPATQQYGTPAGGLPSAQPGYAPAYGSTSGQYAMAPPPKPGPSTGLIVGVAALAVALIAGVAFAVVAGGDDDTETTSPPSTPTTEPDITSDTTEPDTADTTEPELSDEGIVELIATGMELEADGLITHGQAVCAAQAMVDEVGLEALLELSTGTEEDPFAGLTTAQQASVLTAMTSCIPADVLAQIGVAEGEGAGG